MLRRLEALLDPIADARSPPTAGLVRPFYWHFVRQVRGLVVALFVVRRADRACWT